MQSKHRIVALALGVLLVAFALKTVSFGDDEYEIKVMMKSFNSAYEGANVTIAGKTVGQIRSVEVEDGQALVTAVIDEGHAPLHSGTEARLAWQSLVGRRSLELTPGPTKNPELPSGKVIESSSERVELDDVLATLDASTREDVRALVGELESTLGGNENSLNDTLATAGPLVEAIGEVVRAVGKDGPAIKTLVADLRKLTDKMNSRGAETRRTLASLQVLVSKAASQQSEIVAALDDVPEAVKAGRNVLAKVPGTVEEVSPLLDELRPATKQLPGIAEDLNPVLKQLRPTVNDLRPTLAAARELLAQTPGLLDSGAATVPELQTALEQLQPAVAFLRPYTPELVGWLTNWTSIFSPKNAAGHYARAMVPASVTSFNGNFTGIMPPGISQWERPQPGDAAIVANGGLVDAGGDPIR